MFDGPEKSGGTLCQSTKFSSNPYHAHRPQQRAAGPAPVQKCPTIDTMAQSYYPTRIASPVKQAFHESVFGGLHGDKQLNVEDVQEAYVESKDR